MSNDVHVHISQKFNSKDNYNYTNKINMELIFIEIALKIILAENFQFLNVDTILERMHLKLVHMYSLKLHPISVI